MPDTGVIGGKHRMPSPRTARTIDNFRELYRSEYGFVHSTVLRLGVHAQVAEDAVQEAFTTAFRRWGSRRSGEVRPWLYGITRRVCSNYRRSHQRRSRKLCALAPPLPSPAIDQRFEAANVLSKFVRGLSSLDREIFVLAHVEGWTGAEVAAAMGLRPSTAYDRLRSLRARFREAASAGSGAQIRDGRPNRRAKSSHAGWMALLPRLRGWPGFGSAMLVPLSKFSAVGLGAALLVAGPIRSIGRVEPGAKESMGSPGARRDKPIPKVSMASAALVPHPVAPGLSSPSGRPPVRSGSSWHGAKARASPLPSTDLARQTQLLREASAALDGGEPQRALRLVESYTRDFGEGALLDLAAALRIEALCALDRTQQGRAEAAAFLRDQAQSPAAARVRRSCPVE